MDYRDSITEKTMSRVLNTWEKELNDVNSLLQKETLERIFNFLNARENICTADFVLRRHIQSVFPNLLQKTGCNFDDLSKSGNVFWEDHAVEILSRVLEKEKFGGVTNFKFDRRQWKNVLSGKAVCNRTSAIKLIFAFKMDEATAAKFLIANRKDVFSTRNPFDYLCRFCLEGGFTYDTAIALLKSFEASRTKSFNERTNNVVNFATVRLENETRKILDDDTLCAEDKQLHILAYMIQNQEEFVAKIERKTREGIIRTVEYPSGFSLSNGLKLKVFLKYLTELYPTFLQLKTLDEFDTVLLSKAVEQNADGSPKNPEQLMQSIRESHDIYFLDDEALEEIGLPTGNEKSADGKTELKAKQLYDSIPFNGAILLPLRNLSKALRANLRGEKFINNAKEIDRSTVLFLAYFFISRLVGAQKDLAELAEELDEAIYKERDENISDLLFALKEVVNNLESANSGNSVEIYIKALNDLLETFNRSKFYAPFVEDKCVLLCLLRLDRVDKEDLPQSLLSALIDESYELSKEFLEKRNEQQSKVFTCGHRTD
ncbi:MAG: hypothetical protein IJQ85_02770 [Selenomonadaceae bacterium]|nr:hypothetical protein [Selenomonadaceae bacterium]